MLAAYQDWKQGHSPVGMGRAGWLPTPFVQAMHVVRGAIQQQESQAAERVRDRANGG